MEFEPCRTYRPAWIFFSIRCGPGLLRRLRDRLGAGVGIAGILPHQYPLCRHASRRLAAARALGTVLPQFAALAPAVALLAASLGTTALALGLLAILAWPLPPLAASLGLALALGAGLAAALSGEPVYALGCQLLGVAIIDAVSVNRFFTGRAAPYWRCWWRRHFFVPDWR